MKLLLALSGERQSAAHFEKGEWMRQLLILLSLLSVACGQVFAIDPGTVQGSLKVNGNSVELRHAYAHLHDNAEGVLEHKELRILVADKEVPASALAGLVFLPVQEMARQGQVRGLLIRLAPNNPNEVMVTILFPPDPGESLTNQTLGASGGARVFKDWQLNKQRVLGAIERGDEGASSSDMPKIEYSLRFSAPVFSEPAITADLKGKAAQSSPQVAVLRKKAQALARGDFAAVKKLSTARAYQRNEQFLASPEAKSFAKEAGVAMEKGLRKIQRVVARGDRAVAIFAGKSEWTTLVREGGVWKSD